MSSTEQTAFLQDWYRLGDGVDVPMEYTRTVWHLDTGMGSQLSPETVAKAQPYLERQAWAGGPSSDAYLALSRLKQLGFCGGTPNTSAAAVSHSLRLWQRDFQRGLPFRVVFFMPPTPSILMRAWPARRSRRSKRMFTSWPSYERQVVVARLSKMLMHQ